MALNILVVEDSSVMRAMIIRTLRLSGIPLNRIWEAANGQEGLHQLAHHRIDVVLSDINMPVMDGEAMVDRMHQDPALKAIPVVVVSTESSRTRIRMLEEKTSGFMHKPFTPEELGALILKITGGTNEGASGHGALQGLGQDF